MKLWPEISCHLFLVEHGDLDEDHGAAVGGRLQVVELLEIVVIGDDPSAAEGTTGALASPAQPQPGDHERHV